MYTVEIGDKELFGHPKIVPYLFEVNWHLVTGNGSLTYTSMHSLSNRSLSLSFTVINKKQKIIYLEGS